MAARAEIGLAYRIFDVRRVFCGVSVLLSFLVSWLLFTWVIARLPRESVSLVTSMRAGLFAAIGFEVFKQLGSIYLRVVLRSPAGATFGPVLGLMVFAYITGAGAVLRPPGPRPQPQTAHRARGLARRGCRLMTEVAKPGILSGCGPATAGSTTRSRPISASPSTRARSSRQGSPYYTIFALFPLLMVGFAVAGYTCRVGRSC